MRTRFTLFVLAAGVTVIGITATARKPEAQVAVEVRPPPGCPYGYYDVAPYACAPAGYYGPEWFVDGVFIGPAHGFMDPATSMATWITISTRRTAIKAPCRNAAKNRTSPNVSMARTSREAKCEMGAATWSRRNADERPRPGSRKRRPMVLPWDATALPDRAATLVAHQCPLFAGLRQRSVR
jgi:hypothetical protein